MNLCEQSVHIEADAYCEWNEWKPSPRGTQVVPPGRWNYSVGGALNQLVQRAHRCSCGMIADLDHEKSREHALRLKDMVAVQLGLQELPDELRLKGKRLCCQRCDAAIVISAEAVRAHLTQHEDIPEIFSEEPEPIIPTSDPLAWIRVAEQQLDAFTRQSKLSPNFVSRRLEFASNLEAMIRLRIPDAKLQIFGSTVTGLANKDSDVDLCLVTGSPESPSELLDIVREHLRVNLISTVKIEARVPILQFKRTKIKDFFVHPFDLCVNNHSAVANSYYVRACMSFDHRIKSLALVVRAWAKSYKIANSSQGLTAYCQSLLVIFFSQTCKPPILPLVEPERVLQPGLVWPRLAELNTRLLAQLLQEFLQFLFDFDWENNAISVRQARVLPKHACSFEQRPLAVEDPLDVKFNCARLPSVHLIERLKYAARETVFSLKLERPLTFLQPDTESKKKGVKSSPGVTLQSPQVAPREERRTLLKPENFQLTDVRSAALDLVPRPYLIKLTRPVPVELSAVEIVREVSKAASELVEQLKFFQERYLHQFTSRNSTNASRCAAWMTALYRKHQSLCADLSRVSELDKFAQTFLNYYRLDPNIIGAIHGIERKTPGLVLVSADGPSAGACLCSPRRFLYKLDHLFRQASDGTPDIAPLVDLLHSFMQMLFGPERQELLQVQRRVVPTFDVLSNYRRTLRFEALVCAVVSRSLYGTLAVSHRCVLFNDVLLFSSLTDASYLYAPVQEVSISDPDPCSELLTVKTVKRLLPAPALLFETVAEKAEFVKFMSS